MSVGSPSTGRRAEPAPLPPCTAGPARRGFGQLAVYERVTVTPLQASWLALDLSLNVMLPPVHAPLPLPAGTSELTAAGWTRVKSVESHPVTGSPALVIEPTDTVTVLT